VTRDAGAEIENRYAEPFPLAVVPRVAGGVAPGDYDGDGWTDLYVMRGDSGPAVLLRNQGDGTFADRTMSSSLGLVGPFQGPAFADYNGDGAIDVFVGSTDLGHPRLFQNVGDGSFSERPNAAPWVPGSTYNSAGFGDFDRDGDLDLFTTHWGYFYIEGGVDHLWRNNGDGTFTGATAETGLAIKAERRDAITIEWSFCPNFADVNNDAWPDILLTSDYGRSQVFLSNRDGTFRDATGGAITDENGMGSAIGDYDNDGDLDWFVSSIYLEGVESNPEFGTSGNRLYRNRGDGSFEDATDEAGVRDGNWGWGSCFADFDNDGFLDIFHVNGWDLDARFDAQPARLFMSNGDGTFGEQAAAAGIADRGNGRGVVCFDYDRDGDVDVFISNNGEASRLYRNDTGTGARYLSISLIGRPPNTQAIGARVSVVAGGRTQVREIRAGCNYVSQDPPEAHFGLAEVATVDELRVRWPDGAEAVRFDVATNRLLRIGQDIGDANCDGVVGGADVVRATILDGSSASSRRCPLADIDEDGDVDGSDRSRLIALIFVSGGSPE
jgi:hypothetical protein